MRRGLATVGAIAALAAGLTFGRPAVAQGPQSASTASPASAQRPMHDFMRRAWGRMTGEDRAALFEAHLAALHVGLKLTAEQEKLWPPLEDALRDCARTIV